MSTSTPTPATDADDHPGVIAFPPLIFAAHALVAGALHWLRPAHLWENSPVARIAGGFVMLAALALAWWARSAMVAVGTNIRPDLPALALTAAGPYQFTRNPMYLALCTLQLGLALLLNSVWPLVLLVSQAAFLHFGVVKREERYLSAKFGAPYVAYLGRVRRWF